MGTIYSSFFSVQCEQGETKCITYWITVLVYEESGIIGSVRLIVSPLLPENIVIQIGTTNRFRHYIEHIKSVPESVSEL